MSEHKKYYPSNGTDGLFFIANWCEWCYKERNCTILAGSMTGKQPKQWIYGDDGKPTCTSFAQQPKKKRVKNSDNKLLS